MSTSYIVENLKRLSQGKQFKPKFNGRQRKQILSICTNVWRGTDPYRFTVLLYSCLFEGKREKYLELVKQLYDGWDKNVPELCSPATLSMIPTAFLGLGYEFATFNNHEIEMILAIDGEMPTPEEIHGGSLDQFSWLSDGLAEDLERSKIITNETINDQNQNQNINNQQYPNIQSQQYAMVEQDYIEPFSNAPMPKILDDDVLYGGDEDEKATKPKASLIEEIFKSFCGLIGCQWKILHVPKSNAGVCRTMVMQSFSSEYLFFRDDDDLNAPISKLLEITHILDDKRRRKPNPAGYWNEVEREISKQDINPLSIKRLLQKYQRSPTIAVLLATNKFKNTWATPDNPNCITPLPIETSTLEDVDRSIPGSMCSKIFSKEALEIVYNSPSFGLLEDNRSRYLQEYTQKCLWVWSPDKFQAQLKGLEAFKKILLKHEKLTSKAFKEMQSSIFELNINVLVYDGTQIGDFRDIKANKNHIRAWEEVIENSISSPYHPLYSYLFPSGNYGTLSWSFGAVVALLELCRQFHRDVEFSTGDLRLLKKVITTGIETKIINRDCQVEIINHFKENQTRLCQALKQIVEYKYLLFNGYVHSEKDLEMLLEQLAIIRTEIKKMKSFETEGKFQADEVRDDVYHNDQLLEVIIEEKVSDKRTSTNKRLLCVSGERRRKVHPNLQGNFDDENFTSYVTSTKLKGGMVENEKPKPKLLGGSSGISLDVILAVILIVCLIVFLIYVFKQGRRSHPKVFEPFDESSDTLESSDISSSSEI